MKFGVDMYELMKRDPWILRAIVFGSGGTLAMAVVGLLLLAYHDKSIPPPLTAVTGALVGFVATVLSALIGYGKGRDVGGVFEQSVRSYYATHAPAVPEPPPSGSYPPPAPQAVRSSAP